MKGVRNLFLVLAGGVEAKSGGSIAPVIKLLNDMLAEVQKDVATSRSQYDEVEEECAKTSTEESHNIELLSQQLTSQMAAKEESEAIQTKAADVISGSSGKAQKMGAKLKEEEKIFKEAKAEFLKMDRESIETIEILERAVKALTRTQAEGETSLLQNNQSLEVVEQVMQSIVKASFVSIENKEALQSLLSVSEGQPQATETIYEKQNGGVVEMFTTFMNDEEAAKNTRQQEWSEKQLKMQMGIQQLTNNIAGLNDEVSREKEKKAAAGEASATAQGKIVSLTKEKQESQRTLNDSQIECRAAKEDFGRTQADFAAQIKAVQKAVEILQKAPDFLQQDSEDADDATSFLQMRVTTKEGSTSRTLLQTKASIYLQKLGAQLGNVVLQQVAAHVAEDPFVKVKGMIKEMIKKLEKEGAAEASKEAYCTKAKEESTADIKKKTQESDKIQARLQQARADVAALEKKTSQLRDRIQEVNRDVKERTKIRKEETTQNAKQIKEAGANAEACSKAIIVLQEYFSAGPEQEGGVETAPADESLLETGTSARSQDANSVLYLLQEAEADFARTLADTKAVEAELQSTYEKQMQDYKVEKATTQENIKGNDGEVSRLNTSINESQTDGDNADKELKAAGEYQAKIKEECEVKVPTFQERQERRQKEVEGLKNAIGILTGEEVSDANE